MRREYLDTIGKDFVTHEYRELYNIQWLYTYYIYSNYTAFLVPVIALREIRTIHGHEDLPKTRPEVSNRSSDSSGFRSLQPNFHMTNPEDK